MSTENKKIKYAHEERMSKAEALETLGLKPDTNEYEIRNAHSRKSMAMRGRTDDESFEYLGRVNEAFDVLMGIDNRPKYEEAVIAGKTKSEIKNFWDYAWVPILITIIIVAMVASMIIQGIRNTDPDFTTAIFGDFIYLNNPLEDQTTAFQDLLLEQNPDFEKMFYEFNLITDRETADIELVNAALMKRMLMMTGANVNDFIVLDDGQYDAIKVEGGLYPLDDLDAVLKRDFPELYGSFITPLRYTVEESFLPRDWEVGEHVYGFSFGGTQAFNSLEVATENQILAVSVHTEQPELSKSVIYKLIDSLEEWYDPEQVDFSFHAQTPEFETEVEEATEVSSSEE